MFTFLSVRELAGNRHPMYKDQEKCKVFIRGVISCLSKREDTDLSPMALRMECIETNQQRPYPGTIVENRNLKYHQVACTSKNGVKPMAKSLDYGESITVSHTCQNWYCINPDHLIWETLRANISRQKCFGYAELNGKLYETERCQGDKCGHKGVRCKNFLATSPMSETDLDRLFGEMKL